MSTEHTPESDYAPKEPLRRQIAERLRDEFEQRNASTKPNVYMTDTWLFAADVVLDAVVETVANAMYDADAQARRDTWLSWTYLRGEPRDYWLTQAGVYLHPRPCPFPECIRIYDEGEHRYDPKHGCPKYDRGLTVPPATTPEVATKTSGESVDLLAALQRSIDAVKEADDA